ncbi:hypothetical protein [Thalassoroseus pseudoceratinae]|uniref:hypothetical protein n=1 Tax=Thalassoroseus pseudoceratinae TaxID=2713176 RepID=UPI00141EA084|nr:hypothetical protein [Thalassoroseus pseudoceratinae]
MPETPNEHTPRKRLSFGFIGFLALMFVLLWPLSLGPVAWLYDHGYLSDETARMIGVLYQPLSWVFEASPLLEDAMMRYLAFWRQ